VRAHGAVAIALAAILSLATAAPAPAEAEEDHYWGLGVGCYFGGLGALTELDVARYDWVYLCFGNISANEETAQLLNRLLEINPELKIVIRVWPIMGLGDCPQNRYQATFLHYLYKPGVRDGLLANIDRQVGVVMDNISRPENVVGLTFLEELPGHFSGGPFRSNETGGELTWDLERFRAEIEAERGKPLVWDDETRLWWGEKWVQVLGEIHERMKHASGGRLVWYYQQTNHVSLDMVPEDTPLDRPMLIPIRWGDIIKPGVCDGFFAYPNNQSVWDTYLRLARENGWLFFSQVSHPGRMRLCAWDECLRMAKTRVPQNMGYFFYCPGDCAADNARNDDPGIPDGPEWNTRGVSARLHHRRHLALEDVGMDVVRRYPPLRLRLDLPLDAAEPGGFIHPRVIVENVREESFFLDPAEAIVRDAGITMSVPQGFEIDTDKSAPPTIDLGDLQPGARVLADWWVQVPADFDGEPHDPFTVRAEAAAGGPTELSAAADSAIPLGRPHEVGASGAEWIEPGFRLAGDVQPAIVIEPLRDTVRNPAVSDGTARVQFQGTVAFGQRLLLDPQGSRLITLPLLDDDGSSRADADDPTGFRSFDDGYLVVQLRVNRAVRPGETLLTGISGRAEGGAQSHVILRFVLEDGSTRDVGGLTNQFAEQWREREREFTVPEGATQLQQVFLYRFGQEGRIWYGPTKIEPAQGEAGDEDVSDRVRGAFPTLRQGRFAVIRYEDDDVPTVRPRVRVQLVMP